MTKLLRFAGAALCACALLAAGPVLAGSPFNDDPSVSLIAPAVVSPNAGLWAYLGAHVLPIVDQGALWLVGAVLTFAGLKAKQWFGVSMSATMEDQLRQTALTGAHLAISQAEGAIDRTDLVSRAVAWMKQREPAIIGKLGFSDQVLAGIAIKMVETAIATVPVAAATPALDHAAGNTGSAN